MYSARPLVLPSSCQLRHVVGLNTSLGSLLSHVAYALHATGDLIPQSGCRFRLWANVVLDEDSDDYWRLCFLPIPIPKELDSGGSA